MIKYLPDRRVGSILLHLSPKLNLNLQTRTRTCLFTKYYFKWDLFLKTVINIKLVPILYGGDADDL